MANLLDSTKTLALSAHEIHSLTGWPAEMVEDYLNVVRNILLTATAVDADSLALDQVKVDIAANAAGIAANSVSIATNATDIATNAAGISSNAAGIASNSASIAANTAGIAANSAAIASLQPLSGVGDPSGVVTSNDSLVYYRNYVSGDVNVRELWRSSVSGTTGNWVLFSSYSEKV